MIFIHHHMINSVEYIVRLTKNIF